MDICRVQTLVACLDLKPALLTFRERLEAVHRDCRKMDEHVFTAVLCNEAISLGVVEPLHLPSGHWSRLPHEIRMGAYIESTRNFVKPRISQALLAKISEQ